MLLLWCGWMGCAVAARAPSVCCPAIFFRLINSVIYRIFLYVSLLPIVHHHHQQTSRSAPFFFPLPFSDRLIIPYRGLDTAATKINMIITNNGIPLGWTRLLNRLVSPLTQKVSQVLDLKYNVLLPIYIRRYLTIISVG